MVQAKKFEQSFVNEYLAWNLHDQDVERRSKLEAYIDLVKDGLLSLKDAASKLGMTEEALKEQLTRPCVQ